MAVYLGSNKVLVNGGQPHEPSGEAYVGDYEVTPKAYLDQTLETQGKLMTDDVTVFRVPYYETTNLFDGKTVYIAEEVNGN